jgi:histidinol-phosphate phosphatase family protein
VAFIPGSLDAIGRLSERRLPVIVVTNQSAVGRGMITEGGLAEIHDHLKASARRSGGRILDILHCPHPPEAGCDCRKPRPGMVSAACRRHGIDPAKSVLIGDSAKDIECARNAGCGRAILVRTGLSDPSEALARKGIRPDHTAVDLAEAVRWLLAGGMP